MIAAIAVNAQDLMGQSKKQSKTSVNWTCDTANKSEQEGFIPLDVNTMPFQLSGSRDARNQATWYKLGYKSGSTSYEIKFRRGDKKFQEEAKKEDTLPDYIAKSYHFSMRGCNVNKDGTVDSLRQSFSLAFDVSTNAASYLCKSEIKDKITSDWITIREQDDCKIGKPEELLFQAISNVGDAYEEQKGIIPILSAKIK